MAGKKRTVPKPKGLSKKQQYFLDRILVHGNGARAAREAGYAQPTTVGSLLQNPAHHPELAAEIERVREQRRKEAGVEAFHLIRELSHTAFFDPRDMIDPKTGGILKLADMPEEVARAIKKVTVTVGEEYDGKTKDFVKVKRVEVELNDKIAAIKQLSRLLGLDKGVSVSVDVNQVNWDDLLDFGRAADRVRDRLEAERLKIGPRVVDSSGADV